MIMNLKVWNIERKTLSRYEMKRKKHIDIFNELINQFLHPSGKFFEINFKDICKL